MERKAFKIYNNNLIVTVRVCIQANNIWNIRPDLFIDRIRREHFNELHVFAIDCEDLEINGFLTTLEIAVKESRLTKDRVKIVSFKDPKVEWAEFVQWNPFPLNRWVIESLKPEDCIINNSKFSKTFLALFNRFDLYRLRMSKYLHENFINQTILSCRMNPSIAQRALAQTDDIFYQDLIKWTRHLPIIFDYAETNLIDYKDMLTSIQKYKDDYFIDIVFESNPHDSWVFTEKTVRNFCNGKPFVLFSGPGAIRNLQNWGFKTFSPFINESYDQIENTEERFQAVCDEVKRLSSLSLQELYQIANKYHEVFEHNRTVFFEHSHYWKNWQEEYYSSEIYS